MYNLEHNRSRLLNNDIICLTKGWGKIIEHSDGYRVQKAKVIAIYTTTKVNPIDYIIGRAVNFYGYDSKWYGLKKHKAWRDVKFFKFYSKWREYLEEFAKLDQQRIKIPRREGI